MSSVASTSGGPGRDSQGNPTGSGGGGGGGGTGGAGGGGSTPPGGNGNGNQENNNKDEDQGLAEPGTPCNLEGTIYHETETGLLVVNVLWNGKNYIGTLLDSTKYQWAPPRLTEADSGSDHKKTRNNKHRNTRNLIQSSSSNTRSTRRSQQAAMD